MGGEGYTPLFETKEARCRIACRIYAISLFVGICMIWVYRATQIPIKGRLAWFCMFGAEIWFGVYWILSQAVRWRPVYRYTFKERLSQRYGDDLPGVDVFLCTADPVIEPPKLVINTVLSVMAYDYPSEKLSVYLSDDGGSDLAFYALLEASSFSAHWIPFCKKYKLEPGAPEVYFNISSEPHDAEHGKEWRSIKLASHATYVRAYGLESRCSHGGTNSGCGCSKGRRPTSSPPLMFLKLMGLGKTAFTITAKVTSDYEVAKRYEQKNMEFASASLMFMILATLARLNLFCLVGATKRVAVRDEVGGIEALLLQLVICGGVAYNQLARLRRATP